MDALSLEGNFSDMYLTVCPIVLYLCPWVPPGRHDEVCKRGLRSSKLGSRPPHVRGPSNGQQKVKMLEQSVRCPSRLLSETHQKMAFWRCRLPQISDIVNFLARENVKSIVQKVTIKTVKDCLCVVFFQLNREEKKQRGDTQKSQRKRDHHSHGMMGRIRCCGIHENRQMLNWKQRHRHLFS